MSLGVSPAPSPPRHHWRPLPLLQSASFRLSLPCAHPPQSCGGGTFSRPDGASTPQLVRPDGTTGVSGGKKISSFHSELQNWLRFFSDGFQSWRLRSKFFVLRVVSAARAILFPCSPASYGSFFMEARCKTKLLPSDQTARLVPLITDTDQTPCAVLLLLLFSAIWAHGSTRCG